MATFVFSNRAIQAQLDRLERVLSSKQLDDLIGKLNHVNDQRLQSMWETIFLSALAEEVPFQHEATLRTGSRPDFQFELASDDGENFAVCGDVTTVSDAGLDRENPINWLREQIHGLAVQLGIDPNFFNVDASGSITGKPQKQKMRLHLGTRKKLVEVLQEEIKPFMLTIRQNPDDKHCFRPSDASIQFVVSYVPGQWASHGGHVCYDVIHSLTDNHVYRALNKRKSGQLRGANDDAIRIVVLCDNDCTAMNPSGVMSGYSAGDIAREFLRKSKSVDLVLLVSIKNQNTKLFGDRDLQASFVVVSPTLSRCAPRLTQERYNAIWHLLDRVLGHFPTPIQDVRNAVIRASSAQFDTCNGGCSMSESRISMPLRAVQELLAGSKSHEEFNSLFHWHNGKDLIISEDGFDLRPNPFTKKLREGRLITSIKLVEGGDDDDHAVEFTFGARDPAISPFFRKGEDP